MRTNELYGCCECYKFYCIILHPWYFKWIHTLLPLLCQALKPWQPAFLWMLRPGGNWVDDFRTQEKTEPHWILRVDENRCQQKDIFWSSCDGFTLSNLPRSFHEFLGQEFHSWHPTGDKVFLFFFSPFFCVSTNDMHWRAFLVHSLKKRFAGYML